jgi:hypothetical protein
MKYHCTHSIKLLSKYCNIWTIVNYKLIDEIVNLT